MIFIFVSFYISGVDHLFICILAIYISSWRNVYSSPLSTLTRSLLFLLLSCRSSLYVLDVCVCMHVLSCVWLFVTPWTVAHQASLSMGFLGKNIGVGCHILLQGIFKIQGLNLNPLCLLHWQGDSLPQECIKGSFKFLLLLLHVLLLS